MMKMKKALAVGLAAAMTVGALTACGGGGGTADTSGGDSSGKTVVTFWHSMGGVNGEALQKIIDGFNGSQSEIEIKAEYAGKYDDAMTKLKAAMQSGSGPDICQIYDVGTRFMVDSGKIVPVEDFFSNTSYDVSQLEEGAVNYYTVDGKLQSMPFNVSTPVLYYNATAFEEAGLDPNTAPKNFDEVKEFAQKLTKADENKYGYAMAIYGWFFEEFVAGSGNYFLNNENGRAEAATAMDTDQNGTALQVFNLWKDLIDSGVATNYGVTTTDTQNAFIAGQVAMMIDTTAALKSVTDNVGGSFEVKTAYLPTLDADSEGGIVIGGSSLWILDNGDKAKQDAAWKFVEYTSKADVQAEWSMSTGYFAANKNSYEQDSMKTFLEENPNFKVAIDQLHDSPINDYTAGSLTGVSTETRNIFNSELQAVLDGSKSAEEAVSSMAEQVNSALENYNSTISK